MAVINRDSFLTRGRNALSRLIAPKEREIEAISKKESPYVFLNTNGGNVTWGITSYPSYIKEGFNANALVYAAVMYKVRAAAQVKLRAYNGDPDSPEPLPSNHPLTKLLDRPNRHMSFTQLHGLIIAYLNLAGNAYIYVDREGSKNGVPTALYPLRPDRMRLIVENNSITGYRYIPEGVSIRDGAPFLPEDIIHIKFPNLYDPYEGMGYGLPPLSSIARDVDIDNDTTSFLKRFFDQNAVPAGILTYDTPLEDHQKDEIRRKWAERHGGVDNWTDVAVLDANVKFQQIGQDFNKIGLEKIDARTEARILSALGVPSVLLETVSGMGSATFSNKESARTAFWEDTMSYELKLELDSFAHYLYGNSGEFVDWDKSDVPALKQDIKDLADTATKLFNMGVPASVALKAVGIKIGEIPAGDVAFLPLSLNPWNKLDPDGSNNPSATSTPVKPTKPSQDNQGAITAENDTRKEGRQSNEKKQEEPSSNDDDEVHPASPSDIDTNAKRNTWAKAVDNRCRKEESSYKSAAIKMFKENARRVEGLISEQYKSAIHTKAMIDWNMATHIISEYLKYESKEAWNEVFVPLISGTMNNSGKYWSTELGASFNVRNFESENWFKSYTLEFSQQVNQTTIDGVKDVIHKSIAEGRTVSETKKEIQSLFSGYEGYRAEAIARTETIRAYNAGASISFKNTGAEKKEWSASGDGNARDSHTEADGQVVGIDESFNVGGYQMDFPGDASKGAPPSEFINCRCAVLPVV